MILQHLIRNLTVIALVALLPLSVFAQDTKQEPAGEKTTTPLELAGGKLAMDAPGSWESAEPKFSMIEAEFTVPKQGDDDQDGRLTIMAAGGSVEANIARWESQFSRPDGSAVSDTTTVDEMEVAGMKTHFVDISGTYADRPGGPTAPPTMRENYRMLAAVIETGDLGTYFIKFYGGDDTVTANEEAFEKFIKSLTIR